MCSAGTEQSDMSRKHISHKLLLVSVCRLSRLWSFQTAAVLRRLEKSLLLCVFKYIRDQIIESLPTSHELLKTDMKKHTTLIFTLELK